MRLLQFAWMLAGLSWAKKANMGIWEVHPSCSHYPYSSADSTGQTGGTDETTYIQKSFDAALDMAISAQESLEYVLQKRPEAASKPVEYEKWIRIAESMAVTLGFYPDPQKQESAGDENWKVVFETINRIVNTLPSSQNDPAHGFNEFLQEINPNQKPMLMCGDAWDWVGIDENVPKTNVPMKDYFADEIQEGLKGVWYVGHRYLLLPGEKTKPIFCSPGKLATNTPLDLIVICDFLFQNKPTLTPEAAKMPSPNNQKPSLGDSLDIYRETMSFTLLHELMHWFGGQTGEPMESAFDQHLKVLDHQCVDHSGQLLYRGENGYDLSSPNEITAEKIQQDGLEVVLSYGVDCVWNLARIHQGSAFTGPKFATTNADSLTFFCLMMYLNEWNWASEGRAQELGKAFKG